MTVPKKADSKLFSQPVAGRPLGSVHYDHAGRIVLVTGGCHGIGRAIVDGFAAANASVLCLDIDRTASADLPAGVRFHAADVANEAECERAVQRAVDELGGLDVLVNNAAIQPPESYVRLEDVRAVDCQRMLSINMLGYMHMAKHAVRVMRQQQSGVIINIASGQAHRTTRGVPVYGPIKAANVMQAMQWGIEYARDGVRVVSVSPGAIDTPLVRASLAAQGGADRLANRHPLGRIGQPSEIAHAVLWLASSAASFINATDLSVDGGLQAFGAFAEPYEPPPPRSEPETS